MKNNKLLNKKIVICICTFDLGGAERQAILLANELKTKYNLEIELWALGSEKGNGLDFINKFDLKVKSLNLKFWDEGEKEITNKKIAFELDSNNIDIIIPFTYWPNLYCCSVWKKTKAEVCLWNQRDVGYGIKVNKEEQSALNNSSAIVSNSTSGLKFLTDNFQIDRTKLNLIYNGLYYEEPELNKFELKKKLGLEKYKFVCIMVANINERKDHKTLIKAWSNFIQHSKKKVDSILMILGKKSETYHEVSQLVEQLGISDSVIVLDFVQNVPEYLKISDVAILSSISEGLPNVIMEYMAAGLPVIATNLGGCRELLGEKYPLFFDTGDYIKLSNLITTLKKNLIKRIFYSVRNKLRIRGNFSIDLMTGEYMKLINSFSEK